MVPGKFNKILSYLNSNCYVTDLDIINHTFVVLAHRVLGFNTKCLFRKKVTI